MTATHTHAAHETAVPTVIGPTTGSRPTATGGPEVRAGVPAPMPGPIRESCPECAGQWVHRAEGCLSCLSCGWSACGA